MHLDQRSRDAEDDCEGRANPGTFESRAYQESKQCEEDDHGEQSSLQESDPLETRNKPAGDFPGSRCLISLGCTLTTLVSKPHFQRSGIQA